MASTGGFLRKGNVTLFLGVKTEQIDTVIEILRETCTFLVPNRHAATIFILDMPEYLKV
jgi:uncharacterized protein YaaQ